jgi:Flp pilus assembly protein TadG
MRGRGDRGSVTIELVLFAPVFALLLAFVVLAGRVQAARADVEGAARSAARTITLSRDLNAGTTAAESDARNSLHVGSSTCREFAMTTDRTPDHVTVRLRCVVDLASAGALPVPATMTVTGQATEVIDQYRESSS